MITSKHEYANMISINEQKRLNRIVAGLSVYFVFKSSVHYDMYFVTADGLYKYDSQSYLWVKSEFKNPKELVDEFMDTYPIYANSKIFDNLDWNRDESIESITNVSLQDWD